MVGNVWEWTSDWWTIRHDLAVDFENPKGKKGFLCFSPISPINISLHSIPGPKNGLRQSKGRRFLLGHACVGCVQCCAPESEPGVQLQWMRDVVFQLRVFPDCEPARILLHPNPHPRKISRVRVHGIISAGESARHG